MHVLHINLSRGWRGGERQTLLLMQGLHARGVESTLIARAGEPLAERARAAGFDVVPSAGLRWLSARADLVHAHEARGLQAGVLWKLLRRRPLIATRRVDFRPGSGPVTRLKYGQADRVVTISEGVARIMREWGARADRLRIVHSAVSTEDQSRADRVGELRTRFAGKKIVGCIAALVGHKDHATLLRAARRVQEARSDVQFLLLGEGKLGAALKDQAAALGLRNLSFEGYQDDPYSYLRVFDVFAMTSREEGLGTSILDAFVYGVPVVATNAGGIPELVTDQMTGLLRPVGDDAAIAQSILAVLDNPVLAERLRTGARRRLLEEFTTDQMAARYRAIYAEVSGNSVHPE